MSSIKKPDRAYYKKPEKFCLIGKKVGRWTIIDKAEYGDSWEMRYNCICECGWKAIVRKRSLRSGASKSCGCLKMEMDSIKLKSRWANGFHENGKITKQHE